MNPPDQPSNLSVFFMRVFCAALIWSGALLTAAVFQKSFGSSLFDPQTYRNMQSAAPLLAASLFLLMFVTGALTFVLKNEPLEPNDVFGSFVSSGQIFVGLLFCFLIAIPALLLAWLLDHWFSPETEYAFYVWLLWIQLVFVVGAVKFRNILR